MKNALPIQDPGITVVYDVLYHLGLTANYIGFFYTSYAVWLAMENQQRLLLVTKWLYPDVARLYKTNWKAVERSIRSAIARVWDTNPDRLRETLKIPLETKPAPAKFISLLAAYCTAKTAA